MTAQQLLVQPQLATDRQPPLYSSAELGDSWYDALGKINTNFTTLFNASELIAGSGVIISGDTISVDQSFSPTWTGTHDFVNQVIFGNTTQNYVTINGSTLGSSVAVSASGNDTSVSLSLTSKGVNGGILVDDAKTNFLTLAGNSTGNPARLSASGADNNIGLQLNTKGSGLVQFGTAGNFTANGAQAMSLGSTGPSAANTSPQEWLTIVDHGGTTRYIPCF